jgi:hypothetical protein
MTLYNITFDKYSLLLILCSSFFAPHSLLLEKVEEGDCYKRIATKPKGLQQKS